VAPWLRDVASWLRDEYDHSQCDTQTCNSLSHPIGPQRLQEPSESPENFATAKAMFSVKVTTKAMFSVRVTTKYWEHTLHGHAVTVLLTVALLVVVYSGGRGWNWCH
jgi:hypothetical protein